MASENKVPVKFRPDRPIYLNRENTGYKTEDQVEEAVEKLRSSGWLCVKNDKTIPFHRCFADEKEFAEFKKTASEHGVKLKSPVMKSDDIDALEAAESETPLIPNAEATSSYETPEGRLIIE